MPKSVHQNLIERLKHRRELNALKEQILPIASKPYSNLHTPGSLPFWMIPDAAQASSLDGVAYDLNDCGVARILQDTGHDLWIFLSGRGLEIRSYYNVPDIFTSPRIKIRSPLLQPFAHRLEMLRCDHLDWDEVLPESSMSAHQRIHQITRIGKLPDWRNAEKRIQSSNVTTIIQDAPGVISVNFGDVNLSVNLKEDSATEIKALTNNHCAMCGYRHLGVMAMTGAVRQLTKLHASLSMSRRLKIQYARMFAGSGKQTPFPFS